jgi:hypothetical protein
MKEYHKIQSVFKRDDKTHKFIIGEYTCPEFELLKDIQWVGTEKVDGTNIRVIWDGFDLKFKGRTDRADIPKHLLEKLDVLFDPETMGMVFSNLTVGESVCLYGEGYGRKIQKGHNYLPDSTSFILFDIKIGGYWLERDNIEGIADTLDINVVPVIREGTLSQAIDLCERGFKSTIADNKDYDAEGLVLKPKTDLFDRRGNRIITKIKTKDF